MAQSISAPLQKHLIIYVDLIPQKYEEKKNILTFSRQENRQRYAK